MAMDIVIIDDEKMLGTIMKDQLEEFSDHVRVAETGSDGLRLVEEMNPDVAVVDMRLPDMDGNQFILSAYGISPKTCYFVHTGSLDYTIPSSLKELGLTKEHIIFKPVIDFNELHQRIELMVARKRQ